MKDDRNQVSYVQTDSTVCQFASSYQREDEGERSWKDRLRGGLGQSHTQPTNIHKQAHSARASNNIKNIITVLYTL